MAYKKTASNTIKDFQFESISAGLRAGRNYGESQYSSKINEVKKMKMARGN